MVHDSNYNVGSCVQMFWWWKGGRLSLPQMKPPLCNARPLSFCLDSTTPVQTFLESFSHLFNLFHESTAGYIWMTSDIHARAHRRKERETANSSWSLSVLCCVASKIACWTYPRTGDYNTGQGIRWKVLWADFSAAGKVPLGVWGWPSALTAYTWAWQLE